MAKKPTDSPGRVYLVDDDDAITRAVSRSLRGLGYDLVGSTNDPEQAIREIAALRPDVVLMDVDLHRELSGIQVAIGLRAHVDLPVVFLTGSHDPGLDALGDQGVYAYLAKPFAAAALRNTIELVTQQHRAQRRYRTLFEQAAVGVAQLEVATGCLLEVNQTCATIFDATVERLRGAELASLVIEADRAELAAGLAEVRPCKVRGPRGWLRFDPSPADLDGHRVLIVQDIHQRKLDEAALVRSRDLLAQSQRMAQIGSFRYGVPGGEVTWTEELYRIHGVGPDFDPTGEAIGELIHPGDREELARALELVREGRGFRARLDYRVTRPDGATRVLSGRGELERDADGTITAVVGTVQDVTDRVLAEAARRDSEARYRSIFDHAIDGIALTTMDGVVVDINPALAGILGTTTTSVAGTRLGTWFDAPDLDLGALRLGHPIELAWRRHDGRTGLVSLEGQLLRHVDDRHVLVVARDLAAERDRSTREREAIAASRAKTDFLANMSHELRTPLNAVLGLSEAMLERTFGELSDAAVSAVTTIHGSGRHLLDLINDVLDIARVEAGKLPIEPEQIPLRPVIDESVALIHGDSVARRLRVLTELPPELSPVDADPRRIKQVLLNLLGNAIKFSAPGGTIVVRAVNLPDVRRVEIEVSDDGVGIAAADLERIFDPFVTLDASLARQHGGAGLGLALVKRIVELHGGSVRVTSKLGAGSAFTVGLPMASAYVADRRPEVSVGRTRGPAPAIPGGAPIVLLAEDNEANIVTVQSYLESRGFRVRVVRDGAAAITAAVAPDVGVVLMDVQLPVLDGLEAIRRIRLDPAGAAKPIIALTAYAMPGDEQRCLSAGASSYVAKPVRLRHLADLIDRSRAQAPRTP